MISNSSNPQIHLALVTPYYPPSIGGLANYARDLVHSISAIGHKVTVFVPEENEQKQGTFKELDNLTIKRLYYNSNEPAKENYLSTGLKQMAVNWMINKAVLEYHQIYPIDIIEYPNWYAMGYYHSSQKIIPHVVRLSTGILQIYKNYKQLPPEELKLVERLANYEKESIIKSDLITTASLSHWNNLKRTYSIEQDLIKNLCIIPLGIEIPNFRRQARSADEFNILFIGRLSKRKGFDIFMESINIVFNKYQNSMQKININIIGKDTREPEKTISMWEKYSNLIKISSSMSINYLGEVNDEQKKQAYMNADIFVGPSRYESFGLCFVEAMSFGLPVISLAVGGVSTTVPHDKGGILVEKPDPELIAKAIITFIENDGKRILFGKMARQHVLENFSRERMAKQTLKVYLKFLHRQKEYGTYR